MLLIQRIKHLLSLLMLYCEILHINGKKHGKWVIKNTVRLNLRKNKDIITSEHKSLEKRML